MIYSLGMPEVPSTCLSEVLAEEYQALRSDFSYEPSDPKLSETERRAELFQKVHQEPKPFSALCISGGGIRSATFALGALQSLADHNILGKFDYLSTVSGGGYIGSWLTAWIQRAGGYDKIAPQLKRNAPKPVHPDPDPIQHLRDYNNYLTPKLGFFSGDTWTVAATIIRNMTLNWLVLVPLLMFALAIPRVMVGLVDLRNFYGDNPPQAWQWATTVVLYLSYLLFSLAIFNAVRYLPGVGDVPHTQGDFLLYVLAPLVLSHILHCVHFYWWWVATTDGLPSMLHEIKRGLVESYGGWLAYLVYVLFRDRKKFVKLLFGPITLAMFLLGVGVGVLAWVLFDLIYPSDIIGLSHFMALGPPLLLVGFAVAGGLFVGLTSHVLKDDDREWMSRAGAWLTMVILIWAAVFSLVLLAPEFVLRWHAWVQSAAGGMGAISGWISARAGYSGKSNPTSDQRQPKEQSWKVALALKLAPPLFVVVFFIALSLLTNIVLSGLLSLLSGLPFLTRLSPIPWWDHHKMAEESHIIANLIAAVGFFALSAIMARFININIFSIHAMYRNRLIRAYLGASNPKRNASPFTGFAETDNMHMYTLNTEYKPLHVLNLTLNLVSGERLAWQQRKAESFTVTTLYCGSSDLGYRPATEYAEGLTLGTAMAISGAAASPNMGYHSSPVIGFIMTLFNARLGAWLGNPGIHGENSWKQRGPHSATGSLIREAFGLTNSHSPYVYLSDGGHFENLGVYEMVQRRCRHIVVLDSGGDPDFTYEDLGNALRKVRIDMNIPIEFEQALTAPLQARKKRCAIARIRYSNVDGAACEDGYLVYVKPMYLGNEPPDVQSYHSGNLTFPHQTTGDQWFDESQTESYRMMGMHTMDEIFRRLKGDTLDDVVHAAEEYIKSGPESPSMSTAALAGT
ncbi:MAG TPA: patatin-like phospholipase family protein [Bryobacteraceae bacterium]